MTSRSPLQPLQFHDSVKMSRMFVAQVCSIPTYLGCQRAAEEVVVSYKESEFVGRNGLSFKARHRMAWNEQACDTQNNIPIHEKTFKRAKCQ